ncbi:hypothetical protein O0L34_g12223 [Tuta absoluta]|nr:hypothetical protein O0L34_g12223 [Tuta absoluta]
MVFISDYIFFQLVLGGGLGLLHVLNACRSAVIDLVPVDFVNNTIIAAGWAVMKEIDQDSSDGVKVYTVATTRHPTLWGDTHNVLYKEVASKYMTPKSVWFACMVDVENRWLYKVLAFFFHFVPGYVLDGIRCCLLKPPFFVKLYSKAAKLQRVLSYFTCNDWRFVDENAIALFRKMTKEDQILFNFDIASIKWREQIILWAIGVRKYIVKDGLVDSEAGSKKQFWYMILHYIVLAIYMFVLWKLFRLSLSVVLWPLCVVFGL